MDLLKEMCAIQAPAGNEVKMKDFILDYFERNKDSFNVKPEIISGQCSKIA